MNFNYAKKPEYELNSIMTDELISLYGILTKFLITEKINKDTLVFGDYTHLKSDGLKIYDIYMMPENSDEWDNSGDMFNQFGLTNFDNISLFVHYSKIIAPVPDLIQDLTKLTGNLVILPNNKIMEITEANWKVPGGNNLFTYNDTKNVIKLSCKPFDSQLIQELAPADISVDPVVPYTGLEAYFNELVNQTAVQNTSTEVTPSVSTVNKAPAPVLPVNPTGPNAAGTNDSTSSKPIIDKTEPDVWGNF